MNNKLRIIGQQLLIVLNIFTGFLLLFSKYIVLPFWIQPLGRMHPMLLHFPIVILLLALVMGLRRNLGKQEENSLFDKFASSLLLAGALLAGVTVILGLFLSKESGYSGDTLIWHKWTGASLFFMSSILFWLSKTSWYKKPMAWSFSTLLVIVILFTGHYGSVLSHGENFIMQPILSNIKKPLVPIEKAIVFNDLIVPILDAKCVGCHNLHKQKGELSFTDTLSILKGGKSGNLYVPGNPEVSLLIQRIHLTMDDEKHMPPSSKMQLSIDEINLLEWWIKHQANFTQKVIELPATDSLRLFANKLLKGPIAPIENFDFPAADEKIISKLNTDYRTIQHVAKGSPGLDVRIYNKDIYNVKQLEDLSEINKQVISLSLAKLPVKNEDLNSISKFENLRKLDINFTEVNTNGLNAISSLKHLHTLCLSGTKITNTGFKEIISKFKNLTTVTLWSTNLSAQEITQLQQNFKNINFIQGFVVNEFEKLKLNKPQVKNKSMVFFNSIDVALFHPVNGTELRYTLDGKEPDSISSLVFNNKTVITKTTNIKVKAYKKGWYSSDIAEYGFLKNTFIPDSMVLLSKLSSNHLAEGAKTFFNTKLGVIGANNPAWANYWAGVRDNDLILDCIFNTPITLTSYGMHIMVEEKTGIYPPKSIEIWGGNSPKNLHLLKKFSPSLPVKNEAASLKFIEAEFKPSKVTYIKIMAKPYFKKKIKYLLLADEMFLN